VREQQQFLETQLNPRLEEAKAGKRRVLFVDASHMVPGTFLCCVWAMVRPHVRAAAGRQRYNILGALDAVTREVITVTNTTVVNRETMIELLRKIASQGGPGPVTLVLDNARYQRCREVEAVARELGIELLFLPGYSPNLNLIERLWRFIKKKALYGRYHREFHVFRQAIDDVLNELPTRHRGSPAQLLTLKLQRFDDVSLLTA
jgi:transposase